MGKLALKYVFNGCVHMSVAGVCLVDLLEYSAIPKGVAAQVFSYRWVGGFC